jgi:hypothetical protein
MGWLHSDSLVVTLGLLCGGAVEWCWCLPTLSCQSLPPISIGAQCGSLLLLLLWAWVYAGWM